MTPEAKTVLRYHQETKHHPDRYDRSPGYMDWGHQPEPFRVFEGCETLDLPFLERDPELDHDGLYLRADTPQPLNRETVGAFLELSLALSAWKAVGPSRWSLRINPSSGNLHPTEGYVVVPKTPDLSAGVYHYAPIFHALERRAVLPEAVSVSLADTLGANGFLVGITSIFWREAWKYGERAFRYCNHDVGHALAAISFSAGLQGWRVKALVELADDDVSTVLGLDRTEWHPDEAEHPDLLCAVIPRTTEAPATLPDSLLADFADLAFQGTPRPLSARRVPWKRIDQAAAAARKPRTEPTEVSHPPRPFREGPARRLSAGQIIRQRRSAVAFSGKGRLDRETFFALLDRTLPRPDRAPFDLDLQPTGVDLLIFVHDVQDLIQGLYLFARTGGGPEPLLAVTRGDLCWSMVETGLPLFRLEEGNFRHRAITASCHQEIAGDSAFSLGMIARFRENVAPRPWSYRRLFWETGMIGQVLYLEAEARGLRGTGIGCYFDDEVHKLLGLRDDAFQSLYHFTVGEPVEDPRLATLPPYHHLNRSRANTP
jgi:SagB-type dehydrogenase family enzyme